MARGSWLRMESDIAALQAANPDAPACICRCKVLTEVLGVGWSDAVQARVDALADPRAPKDAARPVPASVSAPTPAPASFLSLVRSMGDVRL
jgi:hypothetical protein